MNQAGTMRQTTVQTLATYLDSEISGGSAITTVGTLDSGAISTGFGNINNGSSSITTGSSTAATGMAAMMLYVHLMEEDTDIIITGPGERLMMSAIKIMLTIKHSF